MPKFTPVSNPEFNARGLLENSYVFFCRLWAIPSRLSYQGSPKPSDPSRFLLLNSSGSRVGDASHREHASQNFILHGFVTWDPVFKVTVQVTDGLGHKVILWNISSLTRWSGMGATRGVARIFSRDGRFFSPQVVPAGLHFCPRTSTVMAPLLRLWWPPAGHSRSSLWDGDAVPLSETSRLSRRRDSRKS